MQKSLLHILSPVGEKSSQKAKHSFLIHAYQSYIPIATNIPKNPNLTLQKESEHILTKSMIHKHLKNTESINQKHISFSPKTTFSQRAAPSWAIKRPIYIHARLGDTP